MNELDHLLALNAVAGLGNIRIRSLLEHFDSAAKIFHAKKEELISSGIITPRIAQNILDFDLDDYLKKEYALLKKYDARVVSFRDAEYPPHLKDIEDAPVLIYFRGKLSDEMRLAVAVVGSRRASVYGLSIAEKIALGLSELGITIVSGLARGIDSAAHRGALRAKGITAAVLGCGLSHTYPPENKKLQEEIIAHDGVVLSEFAMAEPPRAFNFPRRNRIISGLSLGVVVVEAAQKSGALITARWALEQGREVFAIPGKVDSPTSRGVHDLIQHGAKLTSGIDDILQELEPQLKYQLKKINKTNAIDKPLEKRLDLSDKENHVYRNIVDKPIHIDELSEISGFSVSETMSVLLGLELKRLIKQLPGKVFTRNTN